MCPYFRVTPVTVWSNSSNVILRRALPTPGPHKRAEAGLSWTIPPRLPLLRPPHTHLPPHTHTPALLLTRRVPPQAIRLLTPTIYWANGSNAKPMAPTSEPSSPSRGARGGSSSSGTCRGARGGRRRLDGASSRDCSGLIRIVPPPRSCDKEQVLGSSVQG